jgi:hypothetical protein
MIVPFLLSPISNGTLCVIRFFLSMKPIFNTIEQWPVKIENFGSQCAGPGPPRDKFNDLSLTQLKTPFKESIELHSYRNSNSIYTYHLQGELDGIDSKLVWQTFE